MHHPRSSTKIKLKLMELYCDTRHRVSFTSLLFYNYQQISKLRDHIGLLSSLVGILSRKITFLRTYSFTHSDSRRSTNLCTDIYTHRRLSTFRANLNQFTVHYCHRKGSNFSIPQGSDTWDNWVQWFISAPTLLIWPLIYFSLSYNAKKIYYRVR